MALLKFGNFAVEWNRVYAVRRVAADGAGPERLLLYVDAPHLPAGQPTSPVLTPTQIDSSWRQAKGDRRFAVYGDLAIDKARVCAVSLEPGQSEGHIGFELSANHGVTLSIPAALTSTILESIGEPKGGGY